MEEFFDHIDNIYPISERSKELLEGISSEVSVRRGEDLQVIGSVCRTVYFVKSGLLRIHYLKNGISITESFEFENSIVARSDSLFDAKPSQKGIQAIEDSHLIAINSTKLFQLYDDHPDIERLFRLIFEQAYVKTVERIESLQFHSAEERYRNLLKDSQHIIRRIPLNYIASYLGITPVSLSRIRSKIQLADH